MKLPVEEARRALEQNDYERVIFHLPAGLMPHWEQLSGLAPQPFFVSDPCFGGCDVPLHLMKQLEADAIMTFGHSAPPSLDYPPSVHLFEVQASSPVPDFIPDFQRVGLVYVVQFREAAREYAKRLEAAGKKVVWGGEPAFMAAHPAQVTGCDVEAARKIASQVDCIVVASDGVFHAQAVAALGLPTFNWLGREAQPPRYPVALLSQAHKIGILVSTKPGQFKLREALELKSRLEKAGKQPFLVVGDTFSHELDNFQADFWAVTACPRIAQDRPKSAPLDAVNAYIKGLYK